ncbi:MAG TPA: bifunctional phosphopantothenoylcysteine decarboxylase/phosphopantothenate--cysteine ligase CoaBC [Bacteroidota bacterium]
MLKGKNIVLGVTGGIAAYKSCYLVRELKKAGASVRVVMTDAATRFVSPLTFSTLSEQEVAVDLWDENQTKRAEVGTRHIDLASWADLMLIAPASANTVAKLTFGLVDNLLSVLALACRSPLVLAPTMDADMYLNETTQKNLAVLRERGAFVIPPGEGEHASGLTGPGRLPEIDIMVRFVEKVFDQSNQDFREVSVLVTAGPTREPIDPVRFIGNRSSGRMGFSLARAAALRGASVTLVTGPVHLETPRHVTRVDVETAEEMHKAVMAGVQKAQVVIMAAAVADYAPAQRLETKMKKKETEPEPLTLRTTVDILKAVGEKKNGKVVVGFALETNDELDNARRKLESKNADMIVMNSLQEEGAVFGGDMNTVTILTREGKTEKLPRLPKFDVANAILDRIRSIRQH